LQEIGAVLVIVDPNQSVADSPGSDAGFR